MRIKIDALDTLFFRDGKPFTMGTETWGKGIFPPYPSVVYGALRTLYFSYDVDALKYTSSFDESNPSDPTKALTIKGFYIQRGYDLIFPLPMDCVKEKDIKEKNKLLLLKPQSMQGTSNCKTAMVFRTGEDKKIENIEDGWTDSPTISEYLADNCNNMYCTRLSDFVLSESKIGIGRDNKTRTAEDSMLYRIGMKRLKDVSIVVDVEGLNLPVKSGLMKLGGEGRPVSFTVVEEIEKMAVPPPKLMEKKIKIYLATPGIFNNGWLPGGIDENTLEGSINNIRLRLVTAAIGRPLYIGGFDMKKGPKPMKRAVPAGSVYYFELLGDYDSKEVAKALHNKAISDNEAYRKQGFGIIYIGRWS